MRNPIALAALFSLILGAIAHADDSAITVSEGKADARGIVVHDVRSAFQTGTTTIRLLLPDKLEQDKRYAVVYLLPVEARDESRFGDGLLEAKKLDLPNLHQAIFVAPTFSHLPWYADHPTDPQIRQESYLLKVVLPFIERKYPARSDADGRLLVGFSKSGWGAFSLLLRHPDLFGRAVAWDAPLMMDKPGKYGSGDIFCTQENFDRYRITSLLDQRASDLKGSKRLILIGYGNFREHHQQAHSLMQKLQIEHVYADGPARKHDWSSGWLPEAIKAIAPPPPRPQADSDPKR